MSAGSTFQKLEVQRSVIEKVAREFGFCPCLLGGIAWHESRGTVKAVNPDSGTVGLMQIHPVHFSSLGWVAPTMVNRSTRTGSGGWGWDNPSENVRAGAEILRSALNRYGNIQRALQHYVGASTMARAQTYIDNVMSTSLQLATRYRHYGRWAE